MCTTKTDDWKTDDCPLCHGKVTIQVYRYDFTMDLEDKSEEKKSRSAQLRDRMRPENARAEIISCPLCTEEEEDMKGKSKPGAT